MRSRHRKRSKVKRTGKMKKIPVTREATIMHDEGEEIQYELNVSKLHPIGEVERSEGCEGHVLIQDTAPVVVDSLKFADFLPGKSATGELLDADIEEVIVNSIDQSILCINTERIQVSEDMIEALVTPNDETCGRNKEEIEIYVNAVTVVSGLQESVKSDNISSMLIAENGAEQEEFGVIQPLLIPYPVKKSSWKSCCEMFGLFSGSD